MAHVFPEKTVGKIYGDVEIAMQHYKEKSVDYRRNLFRNLMKSFGDGFYSFLDNLRTGQYVHYCHEKTEKQIAGDNCTNIIPTIYLYAEALGFKPQIVQFSGFRDIKKAEDKKEPKEDATHFALIVDVGKDKPYLVDPYYSTFGPILEQGEDYLRVGKSGSDFKPRRREFKEMDTFSARDFAEMMERLLDPAESLEMLIAGQRVKPSQIKLGVSCDVKIYYDDVDNNIVTRLFVDHPGITNKAVICTMDMDDHGRTQGTSLDFYLAKDSTWAGLVGEKRVATTDFKTARKIRRELKRIMDFKRYERIGPALRENETVRESLIGVVGGLMEELGEDIERIKPQVLVRTLYEGNDFAGKHLYSDEQHDSRLMGLIQQERDLEDERKPFGREIWLHDCKLRKLEGKELRKIKTNNRRLNRKKSKAWEELSGLNNYRWNNKHAYHRVMDLVLFATEGLKGYSTEDMEREVQERGLDSRVGYLGIVSDFLPFVFKFADDLKLDRYMGPIRQKIEMRVKDKLES
jgi:hypothetical protein